MKSNLCLKFVLVLGMIGFSGCAPKVFSEAAKCNTEGVQKAIAQGIPVDQDHHSSLIGVAFARISYKKNATFADKCLQTANVLLDNNANANILGYWGSSLGTAAKHNDAPLAKLLLSRGADVNAGNANGKVSRTPLHAAASSNAIDVAKLLVEYGADRSIKNRNNQTPAEFADDLGFYDLSKTLKAHKSSYYELQKCEKMDTIECYTLFVENFPDSLHKDKALAVIKQKKQTRDNAINKEKELINAFIVKNEMSALKDYTEQHPNAVYYIQSPELRLALTGPKKLKVGDIRKMFKNGRSETIVIALIKRVETPYKEFTLEEIDILTGMGLSDNVIASMINVTTELLKDKKAKEKQEFFLAEQKKIAAQKTEGTYQNNQAGTMGSQDNSLKNTVQDALVKEGVKMLFDQLF